ncbi:hypothetical protein CSW98_06795 [Vibrio sp. HA2012]|uniref:DUF202 domain-containing protein n=1 Tax=Vibrio sp. HA2012 TaxID=1971595 RepID=UPI000C2C818C|nr:hypothetical protein CSW98_06795 [Vibrio sp. HA2012]
MIRDPGLQPERTSLSWVRSQLLLIIISTVFFKMGVKYAYHGLNIVSYALFVFSLVIVIYNRYKFNKEWNEQFTVTQLDVTIKAIFSILIVLSCVVLMSYFIFKLILE